RSACGGRSAADALFGTPGLLARVGTNTSSTGASNTRRDRRAAGANTGPWTRAKGCSGSDTSIGWRRIMPVSADLQLRRLADTFGALPGPPFHSFVQIVFFGSSEFAQPSLQALVQAGFPPALVVTKPDAPRGRGRKIYPAPLRLAAEELNLSCEQP